VVEIVLQKKGFYFYLDKIVDTLSYYGFIVIFSLFRWITMPDFNARCVWSRWTSKHAVPGHYFKLQNPEVI